MTLSTVSLSVVDDCGNRGIARCAWRAKHPSTTVNSIKAADCGGGSIKGKKPPMLTVEDCDCLTRGVVLDFGPLLGTGAGTVAQEMTELEFSKMGKQTRITTDLPALDRFRADELLAGAKPEMLWGLPAIAQALGVSVDTARKWAADPAVPIYQPEGSGQYFAFRSELMAWLRNRAG